MIYELRTYQFVVQANGTAEKNTRFQIWHANPGTLWLADVVMAPIASPSTEGRWSQGLYLDLPPWGYNVFEITSGG